MAKTEKHVHKLKRLRYKSGNYIFFCTLPDCVFKINPALALGKRSICWRCGNEFLLSEYSLRLAKPHCENCHIPKNPLPQIEFGETGRDDTRGLTEHLTVIDADGTLSLEEQLEQEVNKTKPKEEEGDI